MYHETKTTELQAFRIFTDKTPSAEKVSDVRTRTIRATQITSGNTGGHRKTKREEPSCAKHKAPRTARWLAKAGSQSSPLDQL